jgi:hypothetical protein
MIQHQINLLKHLAKPCSFCCIRISLKKGAAIYSPVKKEQGFAMNLLQILVLRFISSG